MSVQRLIVTGSRDYPATPEGWAYLRKVLMAYASKGVILVHGGARGADSMAGYIWQSWGLPVEVYKADWDKYGKSAGYKRNETMVAQGADVLLAFYLVDNDPTKVHNVGTGHCVNIATQWGVETVKHYFDVSTDNTEVDSTEVSLTTDSANLVDASAF
jgi:hypothetical protein